MTPEEVLKTQKENLKEALKETAEETMEEYKHNKRENTMMNNQEIVKEKVYCYNHPGMYSNNNDAVALAAMMRNNENGNCGYMWPMMMMGGFGMNQWMNNPFAYMMMMAWMRNFNGGAGMYGFGGQDAQNVEVQNQLQAIRTQLSDSQNSGYILDAVRGGTAEVGRLADRLNCDFNTLDAAVCDVRAAVKEVAGMTGFSAERVINAAERGDLNIISTLKDCCCQNKELVQRMGYENQLGQKDIISGFTKGFCDLGRDVLFGFDRTNTAIERAASAQAYESQRQMCELKTNQDQNTQRIIDTLNNHWKEELAGKLQKAEFENSQLKQNQYLANLINGCGGCQGCNQ